MKSRITGEFIILPACLLHKIRRLGFKPTPNSMLQSMNSKLNPGFEPEQE